MVGLEPIAADPGSLAALAKQNGNVAVALETVMADMSTKDAERLHALIVRHAHYTNSARAQAILANWAVWLPKFKKIMPHEYKRALARSAKTQARAPSSKRATAASRQPRLEVVPPLCEMMTKAAARSVTAPVRLPTGSTMGKITGFLEFERMDAKYAPVRRAREALARVRAAARRRTTPRSRPRAAWTAASPIATPAAR